MHRQHSTTIMTQLIINIEDVSLLSELKRAIKMLRGVGSVSVKHDKTSALNATTLQAIKEAKTGDTVKCTSFEDYLEKVK